MNGTASAVQAREEKDGSLHALVSFWMQGRKYELPLVLLHLSTLRVDSSKVAT